MNLLLRNGLTINIPEKNSYNIFYGPNKIGKTQISIALKEHYEKSSKNVLLFDENILSSMSIQKSEDENSFEIMPMIQEYTRYKLELEKMQKELSVKDNLKSICSLNTKKAFIDFPKITDFINDDAFFSKEDFEIPKYSEDDIRELFKPKADIMNIFEIMNMLIKEKITVLPEKVKEMVGYDVYNIQTRIVENSENNRICPVCYSTIDDECMSKIYNSIANGTMSDNLKQSVLFYLDSKKENNRDIINKLLLSDSCEKFRDEFVSTIEKSILFYLSKLYDTKYIDIYIESKNKIKEINEIIKNFKLDDEPKTYEYIKNKFQQHSVYKNCNIDIKIEDGKLKIINSIVNFKDMSKSEQNYFKFLYFDVLVYQKKDKGELHIIVDDPFDSYDDIYVQDSINIIVNLIRECIDNIDTFNIFSHSMYAIYLFDSIKKQTINKFNIFWLDQINDSNEIRIFKDGYELLHKTEVNPYDYGLLLKISNKLIDKYSFIAFSSLLRNEINMERCLLLNNSNTKIDLFKNMINNLYDTISETINHIKNKGNLKDIADQVNTIFYYDLDDQTSCQIDEIFDDITSDFDDIDIKAKTESGNINLVEKNDVCYILIYKYLLGLKIRRLFEKKAFEDAKTPYNEIGDLYNHLHSNQLKNFYVNYNYVINSFNHSSSKIIPPIFVYSMKALQNVYNELIKY